MTYSLFVFHSYITGRRRRRKYNLKSGEKKTDPEKEGLNSYSKYAVGGDSKEVPASELDENDNFRHRREQNQSKQMKSRKNEYH